MTDDFDTLFPPSRSVFSHSSLSSERWLDLKQRSNSSESGRYLLLAEDLLKRVSSWYQHEDIFSNARFLVTLFDFREISKLMAQNSKRDQKSAKRPSWKGFIDFRLDEGQLQELDEWQPSALEVFEAVDRIMLAGYRLTLSYNPLTQLANCTIIDDDGKRKSGGYGLSTADLTCGAALKAAVYKHSLVLQGNWDDLIDKPSQGGRRG